MPKIKNIIFDFGGVLLNLDYNRTFEALSSLMNLDVTLHEMPQEFQEVYLKYERGEMKSETFMWNIQKLAQRPISRPHLIIKAWNAMLLGWNPDRLPWLEQQKKRYRTFILSNTNQIHIDWVRKDLKATHGIVEFEEKYFERVYYSHEMGTHKPYAEIYDQIISQSNLNPKETLFIDDSPANIVGAKRVGINAVLHNPELEIINMLEKYIRSVNKALEDETV